MKFERRNKKHQSSRTFCNKLRFALSNILELMPIPTIPTDENNRTTQIAGNHWQAINLWFLDKFLKFDLYDENPMADKGGAELSYIEKMKICNHIYR